MKGEELRAHSKAGGLGHSVDGMREENSAVRMMIAGGVKTEEGFLATIGMTIGARSRG